MKYAFVLACMAIFANSFGMYFDQPDGPDAVHMANVEHTIVIVRSDGARHEIYRTYDGELANNDANIIMHPQEELTFHISCHMQTTHRTLGTHMPPPTARIFLASFIRNLIGPTDHEL